MGWMCSAMMAWWVGYLAYRDDPTHRAIIAEHIQPIIATRAAVQFEF